jgi:hypothetical protein
MARPWKINIEEENLNTIKKKGRNGYLGCSKIGIQYGPRTLYY